MDIILRDATSEDAIVLAKIHMESRAVAMPWLAIVHSDDETVKWMATEVIARQRVRVALLDGQVVGFCAFVSGWLEQLYVRPESQNRGIGSRLFDDACAAAAGAFQLWVFQRNVPARRFYERRGCRLLRMTDGNDNQEHEPDALYELSVGLASADFYDAAEPFYHLIYPDWHASITRHGAALAEIIRRRWGTGVTSVLDATCGIGTQSLGLKGCGFEVWASDVSPGSIKRLKVEAASRGMQIDASVADIRRLWDHHARQFDLVISCDNSLPHLHPAADLPLALSEIFRCTRVGGKCLITIRDYAAENLQGQQLRPYGVRKSDGKLFVTYQVWDCHHDSYDVTLYCVEDSGKSQPICHAARGTYYPITTDRLLSLMRDAGFARVERLDGVFFQPVLVGERSG